MCTVSQSYFEYPTKLKCRLSLTSKTDQEICNLISFQVEYYQLNHGCLPVRLLHYLTCSPSPAGTTGTVMMVVLVMLVMVVVLCYYTLHPNISVWLQEKRRRRQKFARLPPRAPPHPHPLHPGNPHRLHPGKFAYLSSPQPFSLFAPSNYLNLQVSHHPLSSFYFPYFLLPFSRFSSQSKNIFCTTGQSQNISSTSHFSTYQSSLASFWNVSGQPLILKRIRPVSRNSIKMTTSSEAPSEADSAMSQVRRHFPIISRRNRWARWDTFQS